MTTFAYVATAAFILTGAYALIGGVFAVRSYLRREENIRRAINDQDLLPPL